MKGIGRKRKVAPFKHVDTSGNGLGQLIDLMKSDLPNANITDPLQIIKLITGRMVAPTRHLPQWDLSSSPPPTPGESYKPKITSPAAKRKNINSQPLIVETLLEPPLSPPTSGSSPRSNGSAGEKDKLFTCGVCLRSFGYKHVLQNHERTHTGEKPFECQECHKRFTRDHHLKTHMRLHTGEKPFCCPHCERKFVQVANLRRHLRVHTGEKPYACELCTSKFSDSNQLKAHMLIHNGEKPFQCSTCGGVFRRRHHLSNHKCVNKLHEDDSDSKPRLTINNNLQKPAFNSFPAEQEEPVDLSLPKSRLRSQLTQSQQHFKYKFSSESNT